MFWVRFNVYHLIVVRLNNSFENDDFSEGRLEVKLIANGTWGSVCSHNDITFATAKKLCQLLGFVTAIRLIELPSVSPTYPVNLEVVECNKEYLDSILDCVTREATCNHTSDIGLECSTLGTYMYSNYHKPNNSFCNNHDHVLKHFTS